MTLLCVALTLAVFASLPLADDLFGPPSSAAASGSQTIQCLTCQIAIGSSALQISGDGRYVVYGNSTTAVRQDLLTGQTQAAFGIGGGPFSLSQDGNEMAYYGGGHIGVYNWAAQQQKTIDLNSSGIVCNSSSAGPRISADGNHVVYWSQCSDLVANDTNSGKDVFVTDLRTGVTQRASVSSSGGQSSAADPPDWDQDAAISADGNLIAFETPASGLVASSNGTTQVYLHNMTTGATTLESVFGGLPQPSAFGAQGISISGDGSKIAFTSALSNYTQNPNDIGQTGYVAYVSTGTIVLVNGTTGTNGFAPSANPVLSQDGSHVVFPAGAQGASSSPQFYEKDLASGTVTELSVNSSGQESNSFSNPSGPIFTSATSNGGRATFVSDATNLVANDTNGSADGFLVTAPNGPPLGGALNPSEVFGGSNASEPCAPGSVGSATYYPVTTLSGNFWHTFNDVTIPGRGVPLSFSRTYNSLAAAVDGPLGFGWSSDWTASLTIGSGGSPVTVNQENGSQVAFTLSGGSYVAASRVTATLVQNGDGTWTFTRTTGDHRTLSFTSAGRLTGVADLNGHTTTLAYNGSGQITTLTDPANRTLSFAYTGTHLTSITDANLSPSRQVVFAYNDGNGNLTDVTDMAGGVTHFTYDGSHRLLTMLDPNQAGSPTPHPLTNHYDASGRVDSQTDPMSRITTFDYTTVPGSTIVTDPKGFQRLDAYTNNELTTVTQGYNTPSAATWQYTYDPTCLGVATVLDPNNQGMSFVYDAAGNTLSKTDALGRVTHYAYNALNLMTSMTDPKGVTTTYNYDEAGHGDTGSGNLTSTSAPLLDNNGQVVATQSTSYGYDSAHAGDVTSITDPNGKVWHRSYDNAGNPATDTDPLSNQTLSCYDGAGRLTARTTPKGTASPNNVTCSTASPAPFTTYTTYNKLNAPLTITDPLGHQIVKTYDANQNLKQDTDADSNVTKYAYTLDDELQTVTRADLTTLSYGYDADGNVTSQTDGATHATAYGFTDPGVPTKATSVTDPNNRTTNYSYDRAGNLTAQQDPGGNCAGTPATGCTTRTYDAANQLTGITYSDPFTPGVSNLTYDADGQRLTMSDGTGTSSWAWDSLHRLTASTNGANATVGYGWDLNSQLTSIVYPGTTGTVTRGYDDAGRLHTVTDWQSHQTTFNYDADTNLTSQVYPNTTTATITPNGADQITGISDAPTSTPNSPFASFTYTRDNANQVKTVASTGVPTDNNTYTYTPLNQLKGVNSANYSYDAADNLTQHANGTVQGFDPANQMCFSASSGSGTCAAPPSGATTYAYDTRGNRTTKTPAAGTATTYSYNQANELTAVSIPPTPASKVAAGTGFALGVRGDGTLWSWGKNTNGQLGNNSTTDSHIPVQLTFTGATSVMAGASHSLALKTDGTVWAWGANASGQLGNNSTTDSHVPVQVSSLTGVSAIGTGGSAHSVALKSNGTVWDWGLNSSGQLGNNSTTNSKVPVQVSGLTGVTAVAAGDSFTMALKSDGTVWTWGKNANGQLGNNSTTNSKVPVQVTGLTGVTAIAAGKNHALAVKSDGTVRTWGQNANGQLGNNTTTESHVPVQVTGLTGATAVTGGGAFSAALKTDGTEWTWGQNSNGQLGNGTLTESHVPVQVANITGVNTIRGGDNFAIAALNDGHTDDWGQNSNGQLGNNSTTRSTLPVDVTTFDPVPGPSYQYNGDGLRMAKTANGAASAFTWDASTSIPSLLQENTTSYIYGPGGTPLEQVTASGILYYYQDQLGSTRALANSSGTVQATFTYDSYGRQTASTGTATTPLGYAGQYTDTETGLQYLRARYYDAGSAQFLTRDPANAVTQTAYGYAGDSPINQYDPAGLCVQLVGYRRGTKDCPAHHIVARGAKPAIPARNILKDPAVDINIDDPVNIVYIDGTAHAHLHTTQYYLDINRVVSE